MGECVQGTPSYSANVAWISSSSGPAGASKTRRSGPADANAAVCTALFGEWDARVKGADDDSLERLRLAFEADLMPFGRSFTVRVGRRARLLEQPVRLHLLDHLRD